MAQSLWLALFNYGLAADRPTTPSAATSQNFTATATAGPLGVFYYATDTGVLSMYVSGAWVNTGAILPTNVTATFAIPVRPSQTLYLDAVAGFTSTLPTATGSGNVVDVVVKTTLTSGAYVITITTGDSLAGTIIASKTTTPTPYQAVLGTTHTITLTFTTVGAGIKGDYFRFKDVAPNVWEVQGNTWVSGTVATPLS